MPVITGKLQCGNCTHTFTEREALCEDWRDHKKSLVCPKCKYCLAIPENPKNKLVVIALFIALGLGLALGIASGFDRVQTWLIVIIVFPVWLYANPKPFDPLKTNVLGKSKI